MNYNVESHFSQVPQIDIQRSIFDRSHTHKTSFNAGDVIPILVDEVLPGDSVSMTTSKVVRAQTMLTPIMDNIYLDVSYWFVPMRLVWDHWKEFCGENNSSPWVSPVTYQIPSVSSPEGGFAVGTIADYMGLPVGVSWSNSASQRPSALPLRAYALICNEFWRDENLTDPLLIPKGDANQSGSNGGDYITDVANGGLPFKAAKFHDAFTSALPQPLKNYTPVPLPVAYGDAPVRAIPRSVFESEFPNYVFGSTALHLGPSSYYPSEGYGKNVRLAPSGNATVYGDTSVGEEAGGVFPDNLIADLSYTVGSANINQLRLAFQLQRYYERNARSGTRYIEFIKAHFGVTSPDARLQRPEYLGGNRVSLNIHEVTNSAQSEQDFLGDLGAKLATSDVHEDFEHSFTEHGYLIGLAVVRYDHSYSQGFERFWKRKSIFDFYDPVFANIGEVPVHVTELYADSTTMLSDFDTGTFGYQEAWYDYRYKPNRISGEMRPGVANSLASWHLGDFYAAQPTLSDGWIREDKSMIDRTLAVTSANANQFFADFYFDTKWTRPMPVYSVPGLIDHN